MKIERIASTAMSVLSILLVASCQKQKTEPESEPAAPVTFSVALRGAEKDYAELVVRHDGEESDTWYGFLTTDITTPVDELVAAKRSQVSKDDLHIGKSQTVGLSDLEDLGTYRYIAFGVTREDAKAGSLIFTTLPDFMVDFTVEVSSVESHEAAFNISHDGNEAITYASFLTDDMESELAILVNEAYLSMTTDGKLNDDVTLLVGKEAQVTVKELVHEKDYRFLVFGLFVTEEGAAVLYGTPAECSVTTPLDPALVTFSATVSNIKKNSVTVTVDYDAKAEELPWYAFVTEDKTTSAADLIAGVVEQGIAEEEIYKGAQELAFTDLTPETEYRIIVFGYDENGVYGISADKAFTTLTEAYDQCVFRVEVKEINATGVTLTITHNGNEDFQYVGYLTTDLTTPTAELTIPDELVTNLLTGVEKEVIISDLEPDTEYRYIVAGIYDDSEYGTRGEEKFKTGAPVYAIDSNWTVTAEGTTVSVTVGEGTASGTYRIVYAAKALFDSYSSVEEGVEKLIAPWNNSKFATLTPEEIAEMVHSDSFSEDLPLEYDTEYIIIALGVSAKGIATGHFAYVEHHIDDPALKLSYEDYLGEWKIQGQVVTITSKSAGSTYSIDGLPGSSSVRCGNSTVIGVYDSEKGKLYVEDQDLGEYDDPSQYNYGRLRDCFAGASLATMSDNSQQQWPHYPFQTSEKNRIFTFVKYGDGSYELRPDNEFESAVFCWVILNGTYAGLGNTYNGEISLPAEVTKIDKQNASYADFLGKWNCSGATLTISAKVSGSTYNVTGIPAGDDIFSGDGTVEAVYDAAKHEMYLMEQKLGSFDTADHVDVFGEYQYGVCDDYLSGYFTYGSSGYFAYPFYTTAPSRIFTAYLNGSNEMEINAGSCNYGPFANFDYIWVIREGDDAGNGNNYSYPDHGTPIPAKMTKTGNASSLNWNNSFVSSTRAARIPASLSTSIAREARRTPQAPVVSAFVK